MVLRGCGSSSNGKREREEKRVGKREIKCGISPSGEVLKRTSESAHAVQGLVCQRSSFAGSCLVRNLTASQKGEATSTVSVRGMGSISDFAEPVELLSHAGSCACACAGSCTCASHLTSLVPSCAPRFTSLVSSCAPLLTPLHANGLSLSIRYRQYRRGRREAERSRQSHQ